MPDTAVLPGIDRHPHAAAVLGAALPPDGSPSHAYLFHGPAGTGKREVARAFAAALLADGADDPANAHARVLNDVHPDLTWVRPTGWAEMRVEDVKPVVAGVSHTPFESRRRVFVIERVETMHDAAANRMLKTLEEPPAFAHLLLLTDRIGEVMPTIVSRCQAVRFAAAPADVIAETLIDGGVPAATATACARLALGDGERARSLAGPDGAALRGAAEGFARACLAGDAARVRPWGAILDRAKTDAAQAAAGVEEAVASELEYLPAKERKRTEREGAEQGKRAARRAMVAQLDVAVQLTGLWLRDVACVLDGAPELAHHADRLVELREDADGRDVHRVRAAVALCDETRANWIVNPTEELALEALAFGCERVLRA